MLLQILLFLFSSTDSIAEAKCEAPGDTETHFSWKPCSDGPIFYHNISLLDNNHLKAYPILATKPFVVLANITNTGEEYDNVETSMKLWKWGGWFGCDWHRIPGFGVLDNLVRCDEGIECPIRSGKQQLPITVDLTSILFFVKMLPNRVPYKIQFDISAPEKNVQSCIELWSLVRTAED